MKFLEYLYCKYYRFQVRVGNADIAPFSSMMLIVFTLMVYYYGALFFAILFVSNGAIDSIYILYLNFFLLFYFTAHLYFLLLQIGRKMRESHCT